MKILFIGNSFSEDAISYLEKIAPSELFVRNLYIGGCSLETHAKNLKSADMAYEYNGAEEKFGMCSLKDAINRERWDAVSLQQVSSLSGIAQSYEPYLSELVDFIREALPAARIVFHRTWAYEPNSTHESFVNYGCSTERMDSAIGECAQQVGRRYSFPLIPTGEAIAKARALPEFDILSGGVAITRDGYHLSLDCGRYLASLVLYRFFTGKRACEVSYAPRDIGVGTAKKLRAIADEV